LTTNATAPLPSTTSGSNTGTITTTTGSQTTGDLFASSASPTGFVNSSGNPADPNGDFSFNDDILATGERPSSIKEAPTDHRVRIKPLNPDDFYPDIPATDGEAISEEHLLDAIKATNGVIFPYTPVISWSHQTNYTGMATTHANQDYLFYNNTASVTFTISGRFSAQNEAEARYLVSAKHFFQTAGKMHFGQTDEKRGLPPPVLVLSGYGDYMLNNLPCVLTSFSLDLPDNVDYVAVDILGGTTLVPAVCTFSLTMTVQQTPRTQRSFNFDEFASGSLLKTRGWI
jgi:hypothetical protein